MKGCSSSNVEVKAGKSDGDEKGVIPQEGDPAIISPTPETVGLGVSGSEPQLGPILVDLWR